MTTSVFDLNKPEDLMNYLKRVKNFRKNLDLEEAYRIGLASIKYYKGDSTVRDILVAGHSLELKWYESLEKGNPDYSVYDADFFISDVWACWIVYSRKYLLGLRSPKSLSTGVPIIDVLSPNVKSVVDLGCGFGYTTAGLKELFPKAKIYGTNLESTFQFKVANEIGRERGFEIRSDIKSVGSSDLVFASEYFEHIEAPIEHLLDVIEYGKPKAFILANAFGSRSVGHFNTYLHLGSKIENKLIGKMFNKTLREHGFTPIKTKLWNNRPSLWLKSKPV